MSSVFLMSRRYTSSIAHTLLALSSTNSAFVLSFPFKPTPSAMEFAYHHRWYLASCGEESHPRTQAARLPQTSHRIANSPTSPPFMVAFSLLPQILLRVCRSGYFFYLIYSVLQNLFVYLRAGNIPPRRYAPEVS